MQRSKRGRAQTSRKRQVDWVVNDASYGAAYQLPNATVVAIPLTVPEFVSARVDPTLSVTYPSYFWPEQDSGQEVYAVRGQFEVLPSIWASLGDLYRMFWRVVKKPIEYATGFSAIQDPTYSLGLPEFANERFLAQNVVVGAFSFGSQPEVQNVRWSGHQKLAPDEALFLYIENGTGITQRLDLRIYIRTLMRANG